MNQSAKPIYFFVFLQSLLLGLLLSTFVMGCGGRSATQKKQALDLGPNSSPSPTPGKIVLVVSVDWEGEHLRQNNLNAMNRFRALFPRVNLLHFLNAAYFTKPNANAVDIAARIRSVLRPEDEQGLHLHGWLRLFEAAGVAFRRTQNMSDLPMNCNFDCGHAVPISEYSVQELRAVLRHSSQVLTQNGFARPTSFRAGAWLASPNVLEALAAEGFLLDSSAVPYQSFNAEQLEVNYPTLAARISSLWENIQPDTVPYSITTRSGSIMEFPDNGALADWVSTAQMVQTFRTGVEALHRTPNRNIFVHIGFHQETAEIFLNLVEAAIREMQRIATEDSIPFEMSHFPLTQYLAR